MALLANVPTSSRASFPTEPNADATLFTVDANARRSRLPLTRSEPLGWSSFREAAAASSLDRTLAAMSLLSVPCACAGLATWLAKRWGSLIGRDLFGGGVACDRFPFCEFALAYLSSGSKEPGARRLMVTRVYTRKQSEPPGSDFERRKAYARQTSRHEPPHTRAHWK